MAVTLDEQLLDILACPSPDHARLIPGVPSDPTADALTCTACGRTFPVRDGIPVLLLDEATEPTVPTAHAEPEQAAAQSRPRPQQQQPQQQQPQQQQPQQPAREADAGGGPGADGA